jgi:hypothetical protein
MSIHYFKPGELGTVREGELRELALKQGIRDYYGNPIKPYSIRERLKTFSWTPLLVLFGIGAFVVLALWKICSRKNLNQLL